MIKDLEENSKKEDFIAGVGTNVIAIADDVAPCAEAVTPREALHNITMVLRTTWSLVQKSVNCSL